MATPPHGIRRLLFRLPIWLYRWRLGWLLGGRFLLLHHTGRKTGQPRQAVLEVAGHDAATDTYTVAAGFGPNSQWYQNLKAQPEVHIEVGRRRLAATAELLTPADSGEAMVAYARHNPKAAAALMRVLGYSVDGTAEGYRQIAAAKIPFVVLRRVPKF